VSIALGSLGISLALEEHAGLIQNGLLPLAHLDGMDPVGLADLVHGLDPVNGL
jgi:hypothetical protein